MDRLHELRDMFEVGQRAADLVEELYTFLDDVVPLIKEIDGSLRDSTGRMPTATNQIKSVTEATEMATTEILDRVDAVLRRLTEIGALEPTGPTPADRLRERLREHLAEIGPAFLAEAESLLDEDAALRASRAAAEAERLKAAREDLNLILISLQVQDITAQQLASVHHLIEGVRNRLVGLVTRLSTGVASPVEELPNIDPDTFNEHARYDPSGSRQSVADAVTAACQDDIDALFGGGASEPAGQGDIDALFGGGGGPAGQDDIDALFGAAPPLPSGDGASGEAASQDDIDALFG